MKAIEGWREADVTRRVNGNESLLDLAQGTRRVYRRHHHWSDCEDHRHLRFVLLVLVACAESVRTETEEMRVWMSL